MLLEPLRPGRKGVRESGSVAEMTCGPEWEGESGRGGLGRGFRGEGRWRRGLEELGVLGAGPEGRESGDWVGRTWRRGVVGNLSGGSGWELVWGERWL